MSLVNVDVEKDGLFALVVHLRGPSSDDLYDRIVYSGKFTCKARAERFAQKVRGVVSDHWGGPQGLDLSHWLWTPTKGTCWGQLHVAPTAQTWVVGQESCPN